MEYGSSWECPGLTGFEGQVTTPVIDANPFHTALIALLTPGRSAHLCEFSPVLGILDPDADFDVTLDAMEGHCPVTRLEGFELAVGLTFDADAVLRALRQVYAIARHRAVFVAPGYGPLPAPDPLS